MKTGILIILVIAILFGGIYLISQRKKTKGTTKSHGINMNGDNKDNNKEDIGG